MDRLGTLKVGGQVRALPPVPQEYRGFFPHQSRLTTGDTYTVKKFEVGSTFTRIELEEFPGISFNSCSFEWGNGTEEEL